MYGLGWMFGVKSIALNTTDAKRIKANINMANVEIPFILGSLKLRGLIKSIFLITMNLYKKMSKHCTSFYTKNKWLKFQDISIK